MTDARSEVLARLRRALADRPSPPPVARTYVRAADTDIDDATVDRFVERVRDYRATVTRCGPEQVPAVVQDLLAARGSTTVVAPSGLPVGVVPDADRSEPAPRALDEIDAVVTASCVGIAETGTVVLDHTGVDQGPRRLTLVPDHHVVIVQREQVVRGVPDALTRLTADHPQTWISGPSATSDIELDRVEGVHGPRQLDLVLVEP